ncbi:MAG: hypothetical protein IPJ84_18755 [Bdellovibrionales bacterium]|nr:hypothetical protein [Bdellovibrionales bacterium]
MRLNIYVQPTDVLEQLSPSLISEYYKCLSDMDLLLKEIGVDLMVQYLKKHASLDQVIEFHGNDELAEYLRGCGYTVTEKEKEKEAAS